jgi:hypothetical protein
MSQSDSREMAESRIEQYYNISGTVKLISVPFGSYMRKQN